MAAFQRVAPVLALSGAVFAASFASAAAADNKQTLLGVSKGWSAYQSDTSDGRVCYALSKPKTTAPAKAARDPIYFLISNWPGRKAENELEVVPGYSYKDGEPVFAQVGTVKVEFFTRNDNSGGSAWVKDAGDENALVAAMRKGKTITVSGVSQRGTHTKDTYSLAGLGTMLDRIHDACSK